MSPHDPSALLCAALDAAIGELDEIDDHAERAWPDARRILVALLDTIAPERQALAEQLDTDPDSPVALTIGYLDNAVVHLDAGDIDAGRAALRTARTALATLPEQTPLRSQPMDPV